MKIYLLIISTSLLLVAWGCKKSPDDGIPLVNVDIAININDPAYIKLATVGGWEYLTGGSKGLLVYRKSSDEFMTYDRHCTYQPSNSCSRVQVDSTNIIAVDSCCGSQFIITEGSVSKGPASFPLKKYQTVFDGKVLRIRN